jgi:2-oxoglutarate dehydrogenase E2 component (dihydrolipoamide succinyltransferase)
MPIELRVPEVGESITEVEIGGWLKAVGDDVKKDDPVVTLESEKATVELPAPESGRIAKLLKQKGETAKVGEVIALLEQDGQPARSEPQKKEQPGKDQPKATPSPAAPSTQPSTLPSAPRPSPTSPAVERLLAEHNLRPEDIQPTGPGGRILKEDVLRHIQLHEPPKAAPPSTVPSTQKPEPQPSSLRPSPLAPLTSSEEVVPMTRLRRTVAERLVQAQKTAALLTTFNEIDMTNVVALRKQYGEAFQQKYNVKLGFMSFFVKACVDTLKQFPLVNAEIRDDNIVYHNHYDIGVAVGSGRGLVVPVLRNAERLRFAEIEIAIGDFATRAKDNKLKVEELQGGTFTVSNGGIYGSLLSTPIVNPPQSGVLGMHAIQDRPVAREGQVVIRPMMYVALTYDHRLIDGREAVSFLKRIKDAIENPTRMLIEI